MDGRDERAFTPVGNGLCPAMTTNGRDEIATPHARPCAGHPVEERRAFMIETAMSSPKDIARGMLRLKTLYRAWRWRWRWCRRGSSVTGVPRTP